MLLHQIQTPALYLDLDIFEQNIKNMKDYTESTGIALRAHYKTNKCTEIARLQIKAGAKGITCAKLSEAEDLVNAGIEDVLIANQIVDKAKLARLAYLANCCHLTVAVDEAKNILDLEAAATLQDAIIHVLVEYDIGMQRCGVTTHEEVYELAKLVGQCPHLAFEGIQAYAGQISHEIGFDKRKDNSYLYEADLKRLCSFLEGKGIKVKEVSGTSTGTVQFRSKGSIYTEIQCGSYIYMDSAYNELQLNFNSALFVLTTVLSKNQAGFITDAGRKSISDDQKNPIVVEYPDAVVNASEEHLKVRTNKETKILIGEKVSVIPGHCCTTVNLHDSMYLIRKGKVTNCVPITSRGKSN